MLELELTMTADQVLTECRRRGLAVRSMGQLARRPGSRHWHLAKPDTGGTLELSEWRDRVWLKVHPLRDGGWAAATARELAGLKG